jgi:hypothetical protein
MICDFDGCTTKARYCIEWWGLDQYGENPVVADERSSCGDPEHLIALSQHNEYGGYPDEIHNANTGDVKHRLLELVNAAIDDTLDKETIERLVEFGDSPRQQLLLFPGY